MLECNSPRNKKNHAFKNTAVNTKTPILESSIPPRQRAWRASAIQVALLRSRLILCIALTYVLTAHVREQKEATAEAPACKMVYV